MDLRRDRSEEPQFIIATRTKLFVAITAVIIALATTTILITILFYQATKHVIVLLPSDYYNHSRLS